MASAGPEDFDVRGGYVAEAEVQAGVARGIEAGLAQYGLDLRFAAVVDKHAGADCAAV